MSAMRIAHKNLIHIIRFLEARMFPIRDEIMTIAPGTDAGDAVPS